MGYQTITHNIRKKMNYKLTILIIAALLGIAYSQTCRPNYPLINTKWEVDPKTDLKSCCIPEVVSFGGLWGDIGYAMQTSYVYPKDSDQNPWCDNNNFILYESGWSTMALFDYLYQAWNVYINYQYTYQNGALEVRYTSYDRNFCYFIMYPAKVF
jgi:hypothetical protein